MQRVATVSWSPVAVYSMGTATVSMFIKHLWGNIVVLTIRTSSHKVIAIVQ